MSEHSAFSLAGRTALITGAGSGLGYAMAKCMVISGAKVILVMGHSACGAVAGAIADVKLGNLTQLLAKIQPAIKATTYSGERTAGNAAFVDAVARKNVELTMGDIRKGSPVIAELEKAGAVKIAGAFYDIKTGAVEFFA